MKGRNFCSADRQSFAAGVLDKLPCEIPFRSLKKASCARILNGLLGVTLLREIRHVFSDLRFVSFFQFEDDFCHYIACFMQHSVSVSHLKIVRCHHGLTTSIRRDDMGFFEDILRFAAVCSGVHEYGSADAPGDS